MVQQHPAGLGVPGARQTHPQAYVSLAEVLAARPHGITEQETWALLCQAIQALQDLFLSDGVSGGRFIPAVSPSALLLSARGRVTLALSRPTAPSPMLPPPAAANYTAPEYHLQRLHKYNDTDVEKMLVYSLGECLKRVALPSHAATSRLSTELCGVLTSMGKQLASERASLMHLLDIISDYSKRRDQIKPFSHIVMDLYRETIIYRTSTPILPDCLQQTHFKQYMVQPYSDRNDLLTRKVENFDNHKTISNWREQFLGARSTRMTRNLFASLEHLNKIEIQSQIQPRPKSICTNEQLLQLDHEQCTGGINIRNKSKIIPCENEPVINKPSTLKGRRHHNMKRNPVKRAASRLYHVNDDVKPGIRQNCIGPEFVIRASLPSKQLVFDDTRLGNTKTLTVIMLNGIKIEVNCKPELTTAGQLFEKIIRMEDIEENYFLGLSVLISGDFVFLPSDVKLSKIITIDNLSEAATCFTLFVRIRFFLPSLRGIRSTQTKHLLYLQLRRSLLESQLPCTLEQLYELAGLALQAEFGDYSEKHETNHYFLLEHYLPETLIASDTNPSYEEFRAILTQAHVQRSGLSAEKAEEDFILLAQSLPFYGVHFYSAILVSKHQNRNVWLCVSAHGINLYERTGTIIPNNHKPVLCDVFKWQDIQTLCYSKHYLCILPHNQYNSRTKTTTTTTTTTTTRKSTTRKYKLKMDHKKSYYTFRLASLHHQFFLRLKTEFNSLQTLSKQFGILLKEIKNEANCLFKMTSTSSTATTTKTTDFNRKDMFNFKLNQFTNTTNTNNDRSSKCRRSKSVHELSYLNNNNNNHVNNPLALEEYQNKENENPSATCKNFLNTSCTGTTNNNNNNGNNNERLYISNTISSHTSQWDKRKGVKMGTRAFTSNGAIRMSRSLETVNAWNADEHEKLSMESGSRLSNTSSGIPNTPADIYVLDSSIKSLDDPFLPNFHETLSQSLMDKLKNMSFIDERILKSVSIYRDDQGSLGIQVTEGSDGKIYIQSVVPFGPASDTGNIFKGDQIVSVNGYNLLNLKYTDALDTLLKQTGDKIDLILSQLSTSTNNNNNNNNLSTVTHCFQPSPPQPSSMKNDTGTNKMKPIFEKSFLDTSNYDLMRFDHFYPCPTASCNNLQDQQTDYQRIYSNSLERRMKLSPLPTASEIYNFNFDTEYSAPEQIYPNVTATTATTSSSSSASSSAASECVNNIKFSSDINTINSKLEYNNLFACKSTTAAAAAAATTATITNKNNNNSNILVDFATTDKYSNNNNNNNCNSNFNIYPKCDTNNFVETTTATAASSSSSSDININAKQPLISVSQIALPRSLGLGRKWRGPVRYPVTPIKNTYQSVNSNCENIPSILSTALTTNNNENDTLNILLNNNTTTTTTTTNTSDDEQQIFI